MTADMDQTHMRRFGVSNTLTAPRAGIEALRPGPSVRVFVAVVVFCFLAWLAVGATVQHWGG